MFGLFKKSPKNDFEYHCKAMDKQLQKAFRKVEDADNYLSGKGLFNDPSLTNHSIWGATDKAQRRLSEAILNANDALKAIAHSPEEMKGEARCLDITCQYYEEHGSSLQTKELADYWEESIKKWLQEYEGLKKQHGLAVDTKRTSHAKELNKYVCSISEFDKGSFSSDREEIEYRRKHDSVFWFAERSKQDHQTVIKKIIDGVYPGEKRGDTWFIPKEVAEKHYKIKSKKRPPLI